MRIPDYLILEVEDEMIDFGRIASEIDMPTFDTDALLSQLVDVLGSGEDDHLYMLHDVAGELITDHGPDDPEWSAWSRMQLGRAVYDLGMNLKNKFAAESLYIDGRLPYTYKERLNASTIVLSRFDEFPCEPGENT